MKKRKQGLVNCCFCNKEFEKAQSEIDRSNKIGRRHYCSRICVGKDNISNTDVGGNKTYQHLLGLNPRADEFTGFRTHLKSIINRNKEHNVSLEYLKQVFDSQNGLCVYSKVKLVHRQSRVKNNPMFTASVDRIDSNLGYVEGNIQFISVSMNYMKGELSHEQVLELIDILKRT